jgi:hypothetical protein
VNSTTAAPAALTASGTLRLAFTTDENADFGGRYAFGETVGRPFSDCGDLSIGLGESRDDGFEAVEDRDRAAAAFSIGSGVANASEVFERNSRTGARPP